MAEFEVGNLVAKVSLDDTGINKSMAELNRSMKVVQSEFQAAGAKLGDFGKSTEGLKTKAESLTKQIGIQQQIVAKLREEHAKAAAEKGEDAKQTQNLEVKLNKAQAELSKMQNELTKTNAEIKLQSSAWTKLSETLNAAGQKLKDVGSKLTSIGKDLSAKVTAPIVGLGTAAVATVSKFDDGMSKVQAITGATAAEMEKLRQQAKDLGRDTRFSASEVADAYNYLGMAGWKTNQILEATPAMLNLAAAGAIDLGRAADIVSDTMSQFGLDASQAGHAADIFAVAQANANLNVDMLGHTMKYAGPVANAFGASLEETSAMAMIFANAGIKADQAGTALRSGFTRLAAPPKEAADALAELNIKTKDSAGNMLPLQDIVAQLSTKFSGLSESQQLSAAKAIFGQEAMAAWIAAIQTGPETLQRFTDMLINSTGAADKMAKTMEDNIGGSFRSLKSAIEGAAIAIGDRLKEPIRAIADHITALTRKFSQISPAMQDLIIKIGLIAAAIGPALVVIGTLVSSVGSIASAFGAVSLAVAEAGGILAVLTGPIGLTVGAIAGLTVAGVGLYNHFSQELIPTVNRFGSEVSESTQKAVGAFLDLNDSATVALNQLSWSGQAVTNEMATKLTDTFSQMGQQITTQIQTDHAQQLQTMKQFFEQSSVLTDQEQAAIIEKMNLNHEQQRQTIEAGQQRITEILNLAKEEKRAITDAERQEINQIQQQMVQTGIQVMSENELEQKAILERMRLNASDLSALQAAEVVQNSIQQRDGAIQAANDQYNEIVKETIRQRDEVGSITEEQADRILLHAQAQRDGAILAAQQTHAEVVEEAQAQAGEHINAIDWETGEVLTRWDIFANSMKDTWNSIRTAAVEAWESLSAYIAPVVEEISSFLRSTFGDFAEWWKQTWPDLKIAFENIWNGIVAFIRPILETIKAIFETTWPYIENIIVATWETIKGVISGSIEVIKGIIDVFIGVFTGDWERAWEGIKSILSGAWDAIYSIFEGAFDIVVNIFSGIISGIGEYFVRFGQEMKDHGGNIVKGLGQGIMDMGGWIKTKVAEFAAWISDGFKSFFGIHSPSRLMSEYGQYLVEGLWQGIQDMAGWIKGKVTEFSSGIANSIKSFFGIASPSRLMAEYGGYIAEGLAVGMRQNEKAVADAAKAQADIVKKKTQEAKDAAVANWKEMNAKVKTEADLMAQAVTGALEKVRSTTQLELAISKQEFELFASTLGNTTADQAKKLEAQMELLRIELNTSKETVDVLNKAYDDMVKVKGANSEEAKKLYLELLKEQTAYQGLNNQLKELEKNYGSAANAARNLVIEQGKIFENINGNWVESGRVGDRVGADDPIYGPGGAWEDMPDWLKPKPSTGGSKEEDSGRTRPKDTDREGSYQKDVDKGNFGGSVNTNVRRAAKEVGDSIRDAFDKVKESFRFPGLATGGTVTQSGWTWVGEKGPELLNLPRGSQVIPNYDLPRVGSSSQSVQLEININGPVYGIDDLDGQIKRVVQTETLPILTKQLRQPSRSRG
ncbi:phage tail tape measure protein [Brevibacillus borstelensis]|uniref:phage tail tape measure protein n=1 Tax=Brevibacillus borstelensis TaxID=45462 RepID=UPI0030C21ADF